ncbi:MAG: histidine phosphatase family protein [Patescibacteria group bacterium]|nr:histidine phosphatase family protein [Patescibacteria group bacterium]
MALPIDLVLVRHGQSEGNVAKRRSEQGDHSAFTEEFRSRHSSSFRLTTQGIIQAQRTGVWIHEHLGSFDRYVTSTHIRAMETAGNLGLSGASWFPDPYLIERSWGDLDIFSQDEQQQYFADLFKRREADPFLWRPRNGESLADVCLRFDRFLDTLHRECSNQRVIAVTHGETMRAGQMRLERWSQEQFRRTVRSRERSSKIYNCQILHYTRRDPATKILLPHMGWVRIIRPTENPVWVSDWKPIVRIRYSNEDLLSLAEAVQRTVDNI